MKTIVFSALKGGVGKSSLAILTASFLAAADKTVLVIDADPQNSTSFFYRPNLRNSEQNIAEVLHGKPIMDNIITTQRPNLKIIPSSAELTKWNNCEPDVLKSAIQDIKGYDFCIIDTSSTINNIIVTCTVIADIIVTPVQLGWFDYNSALRYRKLLNDMNLSFKWRLVFNGYNLIPASYGTRVKCLLLYTQTFEDKILKNSIPHCAPIRQYFENFTNISKAEHKLPVFRAIKSFVEELTETSLEAEIF